MPPAIRVLVELPRVAQWIKNADATARVMKTSYQHLSGLALLNAAVQENVLTQLDHLRTQPAVAAALAAGHVRLHGWVYKIETGDVFAYDVQERQFLPVTAVKGPAIAPEAAPKQLRAI